LAVLITAQKDLASWWYRC